MTNHTLKNLKARINNCFEPDLRYLLIELVEYIEENEPLWEIKQ